MNSFSFRVTLFIFKTYALCLLLHHWNKQTKNIKTILYLYYSYFYFFTIEEMDF